MLLLTKQNNDMYRTIYYYKDLDIHSLRLEQDYIDFNLREKYTTWSEFVEDELSKVTLVGHPFLNKSYVCFPVCNRPYVFGYEKLDKMLKQWIYNGGSLFSYNIRKRMLQERGNKRYIASELMTSIETTFNWKLRDLQNRGLKTKLKGIHYHHRYEMVIQLLNDKIKQHEAN